MEHKYLQESPVKCNFAVGDEVVYINAFGVAFTDFKVIGFSEPDKWGRFIHLNKSAHWMPINGDETIVHKTNEVLSLITNPLVKLSTDEALAKLGSPGFVFDPIEYDVGYSRLIVKDRASNRRFILLDECGHWNLYTSSRDYDEPCSNVDKAWIIASDYSPFFIKAGLNSNDFSLTRVGL